jgi:type IV secretion system protein VirD4
MKTAIRSYILSFLFFAMMLFNMPLFSQSRVRRGTYPGASPTFGGGLLGPVSMPYVIVSVLLGAALGAFFSQRFKPYRRWILLSIAAVIGAFVLTLGAPFAYLGWAILGFVIAWTLLRIAKALAKQEKVTVFGSAEWADRAHLIVKKLVGETGLWLGFFIDGEGEPLPLHYTGDRHILTIAPTRSGKGVSAIIPALLTYRGSVLVIDPKAENAKISALHRENMGQEVYRVDPWGISGAPAARFNPLDWLDANDPDVGENAMMLADALIVREGSGDDRFWDNEAIALLWGFILYAAIDPSYDGERSLGGVRDLICAGPRELDVVLSQMAQSPDRIISSTAIRTLGKEDKVRSNVFTTLQSHTHFLDSPSIRESLSCSDFKFADMKTKKMTVYLVLPADRLSTFGRWLRLLIQQAITENARNIEQRPEQPVLFMLDEMAALGRLSKVEEAFGLMAGFGMQLWGIAQDASQLKRIYGDGWETFIANSGVLQYFGSRDDRTSSYFSKLCGVGTAIKNSMSRSITRSGNGGSSSQSWSTDYIARHLANPDELMRIHETKSVLLVENHNPIIAEKLTWYTDPRLKDKGVNLHEKTAA